MFAPAKYEEIAPYYLWHLSNDWVVNADTITSVTDEEDDPLLRTGQPQSDNQALEPFRALLIYSGIIQEQVEKHDGTGLPIIRMGQQAS